ncbi:MAG TPA: hypothetical protein VFY49_19090, partial [Myxococcota bacterium]|nr:hypothetical protein [Myxococcota bacterium]
RIAALGSHEREYVAWAWALNGFFSVIASIASTIIAMLVGFTLLLGIAFAVYVAAALALLSIPAARAPTSP